MSNYVRKEDQSVGKCGPKNLIKNVTEDVAVFKMFFRQELTEIVSVKQIFMLKTSQNPGEFHYTWEETENMSVMMRYMCSGNFHAYGHSSKAYTKTELF
jgi:hypothetical protein